MGATPVAPPSTLEIKRSWGAGRVAAVAGAVVVAIAAAGGIYLATRGGARIVMPDSIIGIQKIDTPAARQAVAEIRSEASKRGWKSDAALYGYSETRPSIVVMTIVTHPSESPDTLISAFSAGASNSGNGRFRLNLRATSKSIRDGATVICAPVLGASRGAVCMWEDDKVLGFVAERDLSVNPMDLTSVIRSAVEG
jgi:hypothetical protein